MAQAGKDPQKLCFVTIGATAAFDALVEAVLSLEVLQALSKAGYSKVLIQYGKDGKELFDNSILAYRNLEELGLALEGFDFDREGLSHYMVAARDGGGAVISHAGSGSILDALRVNAPLIVVPNPKLLDNHQDELAEALSGQDYVVHGKLGHLATAIAESEALREKNKTWPPVNSGVHRQAKGLQGVIDEEMGFLD